MTLQKNMAYAAIAAFCVAGAGLAVSDPAGFPGVRQAEAATTTVDLDAPGTFDPLYRLRQINPTETYVHMASLGTLVGTGAALPLIGGQAVEERAATSENDQSDSAQERGRAAAAIAAAATRPAQETDGQPVEFTFETVIARARVLSRTPYEKPRGSLPSSVADLSYDDYRRINFRGGEAEWADSASNFRAQYFPQGFLFKDPVRINLVENGVAQEKPFDPTDFNFYDLPISDDDKAAMTYSGLRLTTPLNEAGKFDEFISFQGASYFRALGAGNRYGASARGLALSTASPTGEEFPRFREFWLERPRDGSSNVIIYALLDSQSITGAYRFTVRPGAATVIDVETVLFPRSELSHVGMAPLTSMFDFAPQDPLRDREDFRPRVHDSEGLMVRMQNGEWVWRPLVNPTQLEISSFTDRMPYGFGLMQRARDFDDYEDLEARYDLRPSLWIEPSSDWGEGRLVLVEIPTENEFNDNIVAYWRPNETWEAGEEYRYSYTMHWSADAPIRPAIARVEETRIGVPVNSPNRRLFVIDFNSGDPSLLEDAQVSVSTAQGTIRDAILEDNPSTGGKRLTFQLDTEGGNVAELRAVLNRGGSAVSETWLYRWRR